MKVATCLCCKLENNYIREYIEHYKALEVDHIFIFDNNDIDSEKVEDVTQDYINENYITIINCRGYKYYQARFYLYAYIKYGKEYDWIAYFDCDELLVLKDGSKNIHEFLSQDKFKDFNLINVNWITYGDDDQVIVKDNDYSMKNRFKKSIITNTFEDYQCKSIIRTKLNINAFAGPHVGSFDKSLKRCNCNGEKIKNFDWAGVHAFPLSIKSAYLTHYRTKTLEEYTKCRFNRNYDYFNDVKFKDINFFFMFNKLTEDKEEYLKNNYPEIYKMLDKNFNLQKYYPFNVNNIKYQLE